MAKEYLVIIADATSLKEETSEKAISSIRVGQLLIDLAEKGAAIETGKVSVETGKGLSENNFTTVLLNKLNGIAAGANAYVHPTTHSMDIMEESTAKKILTASERTKLSGIADGANAYVHPSSHAPSIITQDASNRFVTDTEKAAWNAKQAALGFTPENVANKNAVNGYAGLGSDGKINSSQLPAIAISETFVVNTQAAMLALTAQTGDVCVRTDQTKTYILKGSDPTVLANWEFFLSPTGDIVSVNGKTGVVVLVTSDIADDSLHRYVTDSEKATWNGKAAGTHTHSEYATATALTTLQSDVTSAIQLINGEAGV